MSKELIGQGMVFDTTNQYPWLGYAEVCFDVKGKDIPVGEWDNQTAYRALIGGFVGKIKWHYSDANLAAAEGGEDNPKPWSGYIIIERFLDTRRLGRMTFYCKNITWLGGVEISETNAGHSAIVREFEAKNDNAGDLIIYFD